MADNLFQGSAEVNVLLKIKNFYNSNKSLIFIFIFVIITLLSSFGFYLHHQKNKKILLSENYLQAKIYLDTKDFIKATNLLKEIIFSNDKTYSALSLFLIINGNLITDSNEISVLYDHLLANNKYSKEIYNLLIFKKALYNSNFANESELLEIINPILNTENMWKPHALLLLGDYFLSKNEKIKAREFYKKIFNIKNLNSDFYNQARLQLALISNE